NDLRSRKVFALLVALLVAPADKEELVNELGVRANPGTGFLHDVPSDHYCFAGEIPWSSGFARTFDGDPPLYERTVRTNDGSEIEVEILVHCYEWERYHSPLNQAGGAIVPSRSFSGAFDLRG